MPAVRPLIREAARAFGVVFGPSRSAASIFDALRMEIPHFVMVGLAIEVWRRVQKRGGKDILGDPLADEARGPR